MKRSVGVWNLALAWSLAAGCGDSTPATEADYDDVAQALGGTVATSTGGGEIASFADATTLANGDIALGISIDAKGQFGGNRLGLDYDYDVQCTGTDGAKLERCGVNTDSASVGIKWSGELVTSIVSAKVARDGNWQLSGFQSGTALIAGESDFDLEVELVSLFREATRSYKLSYGADYEGVEVDLAPAAVVGGQIHYTIQAERKASGPRSQSEASFDIDGVLSFGSDARATLTLDGRFSYSVDTATGRIGKMARVAR